MYENLQVYYAKKVAFIFILYFVLEVVNVIFTC